MTQVGDHHDFSVRPDEVAMGSERAFGFTFAVVSGLLAGYFVWRGVDAGYWLVGASGAFLVATLLAPVLLKPLNVLWFRFGLLLHKITSPIILGVLFFLTITPIGLVMRALGKRPLQLKPTPGDSYWVSRDPAEPPSSLENQF